MDKARAVEHFLYYLAHHPALSGVSCPTVLLGHTERYDAIAQAITHSSAARFNVQGSAWTRPPPIRWPSHRTCDLYVFFYDSRRCPTHAPKARTLSVPYRA